MNVKKCLKNRNKEKKNFFIWSPRTEIKFTSCIISHGAGIMSRDFMKNCLNLIIIHFKIELNFWKEEHQISNIYSFQFEP